MKIIQLFLLFSLILWAEFKLDIPETIDVKQLENIVKYGWNEDNKTLNDLIVSNAERVMPEILDKIKKPFKKVKITKENKFPIPKIFLRREDYQFMVAYTKYLEYKNNIDASLALNIQMLKGLKNIEDTSMLSVIYSLVAEQTVREGLSQLTSTRKNFKSKHQLYEDIKNLLTIETRAVFKAIEGEKKFLSDAWDESAYQEFVVKTYDMNYPNLNADISKKIKKYNDLLYEKIFTAMKKETPEAMYIYKEEMDKMRKQYMSNINSIHFYISALWVKIKSFFGIEIKDFGYMSEYIAKSLVYVATPKIDALYIDYLNHIQKNKLFLEKIKNDL